MEDEKMKSLALFGGNEEWSSDDWTDSDDRVRGGKSQSYLDTEDKAIGRFHGNLDIKTLGGAGFASQRTTGDERKWDLSQYAGIELQVSKGDKKRYLHPQGRALATQPGKRTRASYHLLRDRL